MTRLLQIFTLAGFSCFATGAVLAQTPNNNPKSQLGEFDEIVIKHKSDKDGKVTVEIKDGDILVNGKKLDQYNDPDLSVVRRKITPRDGNTFSFNNNAPHDNFNVFNNDEAGNDAAPNLNKAVLGVITEKKAATGVTVKTVAKGTPADKAGIKPGDVITAIDNDKVNEPAELFEVIGKHQPNDKVTVSYIRNSKTNKVLVTLDERKQLNLNNEGEEGWGIYPPLSTLPNGPHSFAFPSPYPRGRQGFGNNWFNQESNSVKLGLQVQDTENEEGAVVIDITSGSPAEKAGFQKEDIVTDLGGATIKSATDLARTYRQQHSKSDITAMVKRNGTAQTLTIKIPKQLNKASL
ncbi:PDZ domain-containing protein [Chitinophaga sp. 30R24]|uniref:PDZ domain-containing protein n=1 Tax=Chitinophaga sp. 30R24 TaxID=3248838 RepID=UPI003B8F9205